MTTIAVLSDTHGLLRPEIPRALKDVDHIIHAGDLGKMEILDELSGIAPISIVRGNVDTGAWVSALSHTPSWTSPGTSCIYCMTSPNSISTPASLDSPWSYTQYCGHFL